MTDNKEKIKDSTEQMLKTKAEYERDKAILEGDVNKEKSVSARLIEENRQKGNKISALEKELEEVRLENRTIRQVQSEKKENKEKLSFVQAFERLKAQKEQARNINK